VKASLPSSKNDRPTSTEAEETRRCYLNFLMQEAEQDRAAAHALALLKLGGMPEDQLILLQASGPAAILAAFDRQEAGREVPVLERTDTGFLMKAAALVRMGQHDEAMGVLQTAFRDGNYYLPYIRVVPDLAPLRQHPDFVALLETMGLPPTA